LLKKLEMESVKASWGVETHHSTAMNVIRGISTALPPLLA